MYSCGPPHMANQKQDSLLEHTYSSYVMIRDVTLKTCQRRWMIGRHGKRGSGISVLAAQHDDDDDATQEKSKRTETDNEAKTEKTPGFPTKTVPPNDNTLKPRYPLCPPTFEVNNGKKATMETSPMGNDQQIHKLKNLINSTATEKYRANQKTQWLPKNLKIDPIYRKEWR